MAEASADAVAPEPVGCKDLEGREEELALTDGEARGVTLGDMDTEGDWLPDPLGRGEREARGGERVALTVPAEEGDVEGEMALLLLVRGLLVEEGEAAPDAETEGLGDAARVPMLEALGH